MNQLAFIERGDVFTDTLIVAHNVGYAHKAVTRHVSKHKDRFDQMGGTYYPQRVKSGEGETR